MTDNTERRLRESLRGANLPAAPESLRDSLQALAASPAPVTHRWTRRPWLRTLPALAAVVVLAIVAASVGGGLGRFSTGLSSTPPSGVASGAPSQIAASATPVANATPPPDATASPSSATRYDGTRVFTPAELQGALTAARSQWLGRVVLVDGAIDQSRIPTCPAGSESCVIGQLADANEPVVASTYTGELLRARGQDINAMSRKAFVVRADAIEYLGSLGNAASQDYQVSPDALAALRSTADPGQLFQVDAYLGWSGPVPCPSVPGSPPPEDTPFGSGCPWAWLAATGQRDAPVGSTAVQSFAYAEYASSNANSTTPVHGTYLVRLVLDSRDTTNHTRGWQVIGRLDDPGPTPVATPDPSPSATPSADAKVYTTAEFESALALSRQSLEGNAVLVSGTVTRTPVGDSCDVVVPTLDAATGPCAFGQLDGTREAVWATPYTLAMSANPGSADAPVTGTLALRVLPAGVEYLGMAGLGTNRAFDQATVAELSKPWGADSVLHAVVVKGWLVAAPVHPCPIQPGETPPQDTPFITCPGAWLTPTEEQPSTLGPSEMNVTPPTDGVMVQYGAYQEFAPDPSTVDGLPQPREGTYLVRLVLDTRTQGPTAPTGWQVIGRVAP
jgi:hypothetical protein